MLSSAALAAFAVAGMSLIPYAQAGIINMIQGRVGKDIFLRHYLTPDSSFKSKVLDAVSELQKQINL